jgi:hypothetical protein
MATLNAQPGPGDNFKQWRYQMQRKWIAAAVACVAACSLWSCGKSSSNGDPNDPDPLNPKGNPPGPTGAIQFGTPGPWPVANVNYGQAQGILETRIVGMSTDEAQNRWVATPQALYLLKPGQTSFTRFDVASGLHLTGNPVRYNPHSNGPCASQFVCEEGYGTEITALVGGGVDLNQGYAGEVFVGYKGVEEHAPAYGGQILPSGALQCYKLDQNLQLELDAQGNPQPVDGDFCDTNRHTGKLDRVRLKADGTLQVDRIDLVAIRQGMQWWQNRTIHRLLFDHLTHAHDLYIGSNHGIVRLRPDNLKNPEPSDPWADQVYESWMADHIHPRVCANSDPSACPDSDAPNPQLRVGGWKGLAMEAPTASYPGGRLWVAGRYTAAGVKWVDGIMDWWQRPGEQTFFPAFGDPYKYSSYEDAPSYIGEPVFRPPEVGDPVGLSAVAVTPDGKVWFGSSDEGNPAYGLAAWVHNGSGAPNNGRFQVYNPVDQLGFPDSNIVDLVALPDGRLVLAGNNNGVHIWKPGDSADQVKKLEVPDENVRRLELDTMVNPPALHVSTESGVSVFRVFP